MTGKPMYGRKPLKKPSSTEPRWGQKLYMWLRSNDHGGHYTHILLFFLIFIRTKSVMIIKVGMKHPGLNVYKVYIHVNDNTGLTLTYLF